MSLIIILFAVEFVLWVIAYRNKPRTTSRATLFLSLTSVATLLAYCYLRLWSFSGQTPFFNTGPIVWFMLINLLVTVCSSLVLFTYQMSHHRNG